VSGRVGGAARAAITRGCWLAHQPRAARCAPPPPAVPCRPEEQFRMSHHLAHYQGDYDRCGHGPSSCRREERGPALPGLAAASRSGRSCAAAGALSRCRTACAPPSHHAGPRRRSGTRSSRCSAIESWNTCGRCARTARGHCMGLRGGAGTRLLPASSRVQPSNVWTPLLRHVGGAARLGQQQPAPGSAPAHRSYALYGPAARRPAPVRPPARPPGSSAPSSSAPLTIQRASGASSRSRSFCRAMRT
jgi:hypothetical protein